MTLMQKEPLDQMVSLFYYVRNFGQSLRQISWPWSGVLKKGR
jgi:hypothetical protein